MTKTEAGRLGGLATSAEFGDKPLFCESCGQALPLTFHQVNGQKGGKKGHGGITTLRKYGRQHFINMGLRGGRPRNV